MKKTSLILIALLALNGCAGANYRPMIDNKNIDLNAYENDLRECQDYAKQVNGAGQNAAIGATLGAIFGAILLAAAGGNSRHVGMGAAAGATSGAIHGGVHGDLSQRNIIKRCLDGRGYSVLR